MTTPDAASVLAGPLTIHLSGEHPGFTTSLSATADENGVWLVHVQLRAQSLALPPDIALVFDLPARDIHCRWLGSQSRSRTMEPDWGNGGVSARACGAAPLICLHSEDGRNRLTLAGSDPVHPTRMSAGLHEENARLICTIRPFASARSHCSDIHFMLRVDLRDQAMERSIAAAVQWWETLPGLTPMPVPDVGRLPMYSTWYSFHQALDTTAVEAQCALAKQLGCAAVIVDDGWQTLDGNRGYAYCGDWQSERIPDMAEHVARVHALGMQYVLWYSVPFIGHRSKAHSRFAGKYLSENQKLQTSVVDPRFPEIRDYLIATYEQALRDWDLDGFKLDFVDAITLPEHSSSVADGGRDIADVDEAVTRLLGDVVRRLRPLKPDLLVEFRQSYIGPVMRTYGNLFRAGDCPNDAIANRLRTLDIRLLCGSTACHSDMIMWHTEDPVESAALQMVNILFSVPQISVLIDRLPPAHQAMLRFWLRWWIDHRTTLLDGQLSVRHPELGYTQACATSASECIACAYSREPIAPADRPYIAAVNATRSPGIILDLPHSMGQRRCLLRDACGRVITEQTQMLGAGLHAFAVPPAGMIEVVA